MKEAHEFVGIVLYTGTEVLSFGENPQGLSPLGHGIMELWNSGIIHCGMAARYQFRMSCAKRRERNGVEPLAEAERVFAE